MITSDLIDWIVIPAASLVLIITLPVGHWFEQLRDGNLVRHYRRVTKYFGKGRPTAGG